MSTLSIGLFTLSTGEDVIGQYDKEQLNNSNVCAIIRPMVFVPADSGDGLGLKDLVLLSSENTINIGREHIITITTPIEELGQYYLDAIIHSDNYTLPLVKNMIDMAHADLKAAISHTRTSKVVANLLARANGSVLH
jgi:hypothetical protein